MSPAEKVIAKFGGIRKLARAINLDPTSVHNWKVSGHVPPARYRAILAAGKKLRVPVTRDDFFEDDLLEEEQAA